MTDSEANQRNQLLKTDTRGRVRSTQQQRDAVLDAYEASGLSGPEFSRVYGIKYQTFATWRQKRREGREEGKGNGSQQPVTLVEVTPERPPACSLHIELPGGCCIEVSDQNQTRMAAQLLAELATAQGEGRPC